MTRQRFEQAMYLMRRHDPQAREEGFHLLLPVAAEHVDELIDAFEDEQDDHGLRCWLLELIGAARSPKTLPVLEAQLNSADEALRQWAVHGLGHLNTEETRRLLWRSTRDPTNHSHIQGGYKRAPDVGHRTFE